MFFNSVNFLAFFSIVFCLHWYIFWNNKIKQNLFLLIASFIFYSFWDIRFLLPLIFTILLDFFLGRSIYKTNNKQSKKILVFISVFINLCLLSFFKYFNFLVDNLVDLFSIFGIIIKFRLPEYFLPIGISFYTFHGLSYIFDIYRSKIKPESNLVNYALFVSFFPLLVAGPIERATHLLPQLSIKRKFDYEKAVCGLKQILWGFFKKIVIADNCAEYVNLIFSDYQNFHGSTLLIGAFLFSFQIYGDFSGYTDIALGTARLFGIELLKNFSFPYFSKNIVEFWHKWHISLSSWFRDYLYIPLGGSKRGNLVKVRNIFIVFLISGFWHGANFTFIVWGLINALAYVVTLVLYNEGKRVEQNSSGKVFFSIAFNFIIVSLFWIFFRSENLHQALVIIASIFSGSLFSIPQILPKTVFLLLLAFILIEWRGRNYNFAIENNKLFENKYMMKIFYYYVLLLVIYYFGKDFQFIYFQF